MVTTELAESRAAAPVGARGLLARSSIGEIAMLALVVLAGVAGVVLRVLVAHQALFGDELSTYWIVATHGLHQVLSLLASTSSIHHAEITPPLTFVLSWFAVQLGHSPELLRAPALIAGTLSIPGIYLLGARTVGRTAAAVATALTALSPFMIYYSAEARAYGVMMLLVIGSTLSMLSALDTGRTRWWVLYAVCSCLALYSHYTSGFVLGAQLLWLLWLHPEARRPAILANVGVVAGLLPWLPGMIQDFRSPTVTILSALSPFTAHDVPIVLGHWAIGYPYADSVTLAQLPGPIALVLLSLAAAIAIAAGVVRAGSTRLRQIDRRLLLVALLAIATPLGEALVSLVSTHLFGVRNLAASWPALVLAFSALLIAAGPRLRVLAAGLAIVAFALGGARMLSASDSRPDYRAAANLIARTQQPGDVLIDGTGEISPGPLTPMDLTLRRPITVIRAGAPAERDHPYGFSDPIVPFGTAIRQALALARGHRIFVVSTISAKTDIAQLRIRTAPLSQPIPAPYHLITDRIYAGIARVEVRLYARG